VSRHILLITSCAQNVLLQCECKWQTLTPLANSRLNNLHFTRYCSDSEVAKSTVICIEFLPDFARQKLLKSAHAAWSYSKNKSGTFFTARCGCSSGCLLVVTISRCTAYLYSSHKQHLHNLHQIGKIRSPIYSPQNLLLFVY